MVALTSRCSGPCSQEEREDVEGGSRVGVRVGKERQPMRIASDVMVQTFGKDRQTREDAALSWSRVATIREDQERSEWSIAGGACLVRASVVGCMGGLESRPLFLDH